MFSLLIMTLLSLSNDPVELDAPTQIIRRVRTAPVLARPDRQPVRFAGVTRGARRSLLSFTVGGRLDVRNLEIGDKVSTGQVLARLDSREFANGLAGVRAELAALDVELAQWDRDRDRLEGLYMSKAASLEELEKTRTGRRAAYARRDGLKARIDELTRLIGETELTAPFNGVVTEVFFEPGEYVPPGRPALAVSDRKTVEVEIEVPEDQIVNLETGQIVRVDLPVLRRYDLTGRITSASAGSIGPGRLFPVVIELSDVRDAMPGLTAEVVLPARDGPPRCRWRPWSTQPAGKPMSSLFATDAPTAFRSAWVPCWTATWC